MEEVLRGVPKPHFPHSPKNSNNLDSMSTFSRTCPTATEMHK
jgi:hypothetical protein